MPDSTTIANAALAEVGASMIASLDDPDSTLAHLVRTHYPDALDATLAMHPWPFATVYVGLVRHGTTPAFRWQYQYLLPTTPHCLVVRETDKGVGTRWELGTHPTAGRVLFSNESAVSIAYTARIENVNDWTPLAVQVFIKLLASKLAKPITGQTTLEQQLLDEAAALLTQGQAHALAEGGGGQLQTVADEDPTLALWNAALGELGVPALADANERTTLTTQLRLQAPRTRDEVLALHPWNFARREAALVVSPTTPLVTWAYQYPLPTDCVLVRHTDEGNGAVWERGFDPTDGPILYSNRDAVSIVYTFRQVDLAVWEPLALAVLVKLLAGKIAPAVAATLTGNTQAALLKMGQLRSEEAGALLQEARTRDGQEGYPLMLRPNTTLVRARHSWGGRVFEGLLPGRSVS